MESSHFFSLTVAPEPRWCPAVIAAAREYLSVWEFPSRLVETTAGAVGEACEELSRICIENGIVSPYEVHFEWQGDAVVIRLVYNARIPLNPHKEKDYEVPGEIGAVDEASVDGLWLHLIRQQMDRLFFRVDGSRHSLVMMKYIRSEDKTRQFWVMGLLPRLRSDLMVEVPPDQKGVAIPTGALIQDKRTHIVLKLSASEAFIIRRFDGRTPFHDIYLDHISEIGPISPQRLARIYERLEASGMLEGAGKSRSRWKNLAARLLSPGFIIPKADELVGYLHDRLRFLFSPFGVVLLLLAGLSGIWPLAVHYQAFETVFSNLDKVFLANPSMVAAFYGLFLLTVTIHELAHGTACKHYGGSVPRIGVMWYLAMFIFFCDTSSAWNFSRKSQRIWVSLAGPISTWAALGAILWMAGWTAGAGSPWLAMWVVLAVMVAFGLAMNFNPLLRMDAYYMLMDWTGIANLQKRALHYLRSHIPGLRPRAGRDKKDALSPYERRVFLVYGILSVLMSIAFLMLPLGHLFYLVSKKRDLTVAGVFTAIAVALIAARLLARGAGALYAARHREYKLT